MESLDLVLVQKEKVMGITGNESEGSADGLHELQTYFFEVIYELYNKNRYNPERKNHSRIFRSAKTDAAKRP